MSRSNVWSLLLVVLSVGLAACVPATPTPTPEPTPTSVPEPTPTSVPTAAAAVKATQHPELGTILTDASGRSLYLFTRDEDNKSNCSGQCAQNWPALVSVGDPVAGEGVTGELLATIQRDDGSTQVTYNGWPLYYFAPDQVPGDANGQNVGGVWFVVSTYGGPIQNNASVNITEHPELGAILSDASGRTVYLFTRDEPNTSNCSDRCIQVWPALLTVGDPVAGEGVVADLLGTITRSDGSTQVTYNGSPLYYFAPDAKPGDTLGQGVNEVWFVVSPEGEAVTVSAM